MRLGTWRFLALATTLAALGCGKTTTKDATQPEAATKPTLGEERVTDRFVTSAGEVTVTPITHATVLFGFGGKSIYLDPWSKGNYAGLPKADVVFITDIHPDHLDKAALESIRRPDTLIVGPPAVAEQLPGIVVMKNGDQRDVAGIHAEAIPMYNLVRGPEAGKLFHDKGRGNGYVLGFGDKRFYLSGDTECTGEMKALANIDVAFVCMNLPYTMTPAEAATCVSAFKPKVVFPYHYRDSSLDEFEAALGKGVSEVRRREWYPK